MDFDDDGVIDVTEEEFFELTESMLEEDSNNCARYFWYNLQERRQGEEDVCDEPLFQNVDEEMFEVETIKKLIALHDNYEPVNFKQQQYTSNFIYTYKRYISLPSLQLELNIFDFRLYLKKKMLPEKKGKKSSTS